MIKEFKIGEKVAVYDDGVRIVCHIQETYGYCATTVKVNARDYHDWKHKIVHVGQVRKFKKDPTKEVWIYEPHVVAEKVEFMAGSATKAHVANNGNIGHGWVKYIKRHE